MINIIGSVDRCDEALIEGWITMPKDSATKLAIEFVLDEHVVGRCVADQFRQDLKDADLGEGNCAFSFPTPAFIPN